MVYDDNGNSVCDCEILFPNFGETSSCVGKQGSLFVEKHVPKRA